MDTAEFALQTLSSQFAERINEVDKTIGENNDYGAGIGPHDEDDQIDALVKAVKQKGSFSGPLFTCLVLPPSDGSLRRCHGVLPSD